MKSARGTGLYWRISIGPRASAAACKAVVERPGVEDVGGEASGLMPSRASSAVRSSRRSALREMRATVWPALPKRRAVARPRPGPAPMSAKVVMVSPCASSAVAGPVAAPPRCGPRGVDASALRARAGS